MVGYEELPVTGIKKFIDSATATSLQWKNNATHNNSIIPTVPNRKDKYIILPFKLNIEFVT